MHVNGNLLTVAFSALMACSLVKPRLITMAMFSSEGVGPAPPPPDVTAGAGFECSKGAEKSVVEYMNGMCIYAYIQTTRTKIFNVVNIIGLSIQL